jgi:hypothetical protein
MGSTYSVIAPIASITGSILAGTSMRDNIEHAQIQN